MITILVQNQIHESVREFVDTPENAIMQFCFAASAQGIRGFDHVDPCGDTTLNSLQLDQLIADLSSDEILSWLADGDRAIADLLRAAASEAREVSGYLFFEGD